MTKPWMDIYPFNNRHLDIVRTAEILEPTPEQKEHIERLWAPKREKGWKSAWIPIVQEIRFENEMSSVYCGAMTYAQTWGLLDALKNDLSFAPKQGFVNNLSAGFITATKDGKIIFQRRKPDVHCPNMLIHEPCGYMNSMAFASKERCSDRENASDSRLFDLETQLEAKKVRLAQDFGIDANLVKYDKIQDYIGCGWLTKEMYFSCSGRINANECELKIPDGEEFFFVPFEHIKELILNQGRLSKIDARGYRPTDPREIPLIDESLSGLIWSYEKLTGDKLDIKETAERLSREGLDTRIYDTSPGKKYAFSCAN